MNILSPFRYLKRIKLGLAYIENLTEKRIDETSFQNIPSMIHHIEKSIRKADSENSKLLYPGGYGILRKEGMSSVRVRHLLNNICSIDGVNHLEVGTWKGSTLLASKFKNGLRSIAIDNWSQFNGPKTDFLNNLKEYGFDSSTQFIDGDCFTVNLNEFKKKIQIYLYDGEHSYESQFKAFSYFDNVLDNVFIAMVDDYNDAGVQQGTQDVFKQLKYKIHYERFLPSRFNADYESWWNGFYVALIEKDHHPAA
jgi:hypothetical protein